MLTHQKPSSVKAAKSHLKTYIRKHLGKVLLHELTPQIQQNFVTLLSQKVSRKTVPQRPRDSFLDDADGEIVGLLHTARHGGRAGFAGGQDSQSAALFHRRASAQNHHDRLLTRGAPCSPSPQ